MDEAVVGCAGKVGGGTIVVSMLGTEAPTTSLPKGAFFNCMSRGVLIAPEAVWEGKLCSPSPFAKYCAAFYIVFPFFDVRWSLSGENSWDPIITGGKKEGRGRWGARSKKMLLETGSYCAGGQASLYYE